MTKTVVFKPPATNRKTTTLYDSVKKLSSTMSAPKLMCALTTTADVFMRHNGDKRLFYNVCTALMKKILTGTWFGGAGCVVALGAVLDTVIETERMLFNRSTVLNYVVGFLAAHSDGTNLQCVFNLQLLDYVLNKYYT
ncbi:hypothetical protein [Perigonia lusca single nucleopolyhedrovirus]|uniref:Uncharacterized protein n=1 Tax=Perigonia lusca single nucleopolyhedrovirus TaxID=1675865 RepID=A0A0M3N075_9ABAC|nr:hypothetical protein [Perigonia lusca single nucleopolyhedrovirus]AKN80679.1 hypothetical protein [Perigonia lusca single nucleopolyhedrovirus]